MFSVIWTSVIVGTYQRSIREAHPSADCFIFVFCACIWNRHHCARFLLDGHFWETMYINSILKFRSDYELPASLEVLLLIKMPFLFIFSFFLALFSASTFFLADSGHWRGIHSCSGGNESRGRCAGVGFGGTRLSPPSLCRRWRGHLGQRHWQASRGEGSLLFLPAFTSHDFLQHALYWFLNSNLGLCPLICDLKQSALFFCIHYFLTKINCLFNQPCRTWAG